MRRTMALGIVLGVCAAGAARAEQTLESVENEVEALWSKIGAFTAKITTDTTMSMALASVTAHGTGTIECAKQGDQTLFRLEVVNHTKMPVIGTVEQKLLTVYDGKVVINDMETQGMRNAFRMPHDTARKNGPAGGRSMFAGYRD
ncbi:MAG: hypothetical protein FJY92_07715, partial [Candidatus Hydrogenedentes bacterium]|nr:hypothetical protein [Candidatus Hydrogenedentota bacterium]